MSLVVFFSLVFFAASTGAIFRPDRWYEGLAKPRWTPPNGAFPLVWSVLYVMIAIAGWRVWRAEGLSLALAFWGAQWVFNAAWSWLFFGQRRMDRGMVDIALLWLSVAGFIVASWSVDRLAAWLFGPYLAWVSTAAMLNRAMMRLNPGEARGPAA